MDEKECCESQDCGDAAEIRISALPPSKLVRTTVLQCRTFVSVSMRLNAIKQQIDNRERRRKITACSKSQEEQNQKQSTKQPPYCG